MDPSTIVKREMLVHKSTASILTVQSSIFSHFLIVSKCKKIFHKLLEFNSIAIRLLTIVEKNILHQEELQNF